MSDGRVLEEVIEELQRQINLLLTEEELNVSEQEVEDE